MSVSVQIVVGNPSPGSRTRRAAELLVGRLAPRARVETIELGEYGAELFDFASARVGTLNAAVAAADVAVFATPTYKGTYTGLLKAFLDRYGTNGLAGVVAIPLQTGGSMGHSLAPNATLAPLLLELGAILPGRGLYLPMDREAELEELVRAAADEYADNLRRLSRVAGARAG